MTKTKWVKPVFLLLLSVFFLYVYVGNAGLISESITQNQADIASDGLAAQDEYGQTFHFNKNNLSGVSFQLGTFMRKNEGTLVVGIRNLGSTRDIYQTSIQADSIIDNEWFDFRFPPVKFSKGNDYYVYIKSEDSPVDQAITAYSSTEDTYAGGEFTINGEPQPGDLAFKAYYNRTIFAYIYENISGWF
ncbi:hypothetical protein [Paenibacillus sp. sgz500958]|uniref:hypothetical protein n=1 Tax=Paenibacillus sp. sgz500958 TaxID=3242475 RepID=UPI0036D31F8A